MRSALAERSEFLGCQTPRISLVPEGVAHPDADAAIEFAAACGVVLDPWQEFILRASLMRVRISAALWKWAAFALGLCVPRQNGKNGLAEIREFIGPLLLGEKLLIHSAHLGDTVRESFVRMDHILEANEWLSREVKHIRRQNGHEAIEFQNRARIRYRTRTLSGGRGFSGDFVLFDEAMYLSETSMASILPVLSARPDPQLWYMGSAVDQIDHHDGIVFSRVRARALAGDPRLAFFEWSVDADGPEMVTDAVAADPAAWAVANPALGIRITPEYVADERRELGARSFAVERLGVGDWPSIDQTDSGPITLAEWNDLLDEASELQDPVCLAFDVSPDRRSSIVAAGRNQNGDLHVELLDSKPGTGWLGAALARYVERHSPESVSFSASSPAASVAAELEEAGIELEEVSVEEHAQACGRLVDRVNEGEMRHLGSNEFANAIRGAATRPYSDAWLWSRKSSAVDISPLVAATLAVDAAANSDTDSGVLIY